MIMRSCPGRTQDFMALLHTRVGASPASLVNLVGSLPPYRVVGSEARATPSCRGRLASRRLLPMEASGDQSRQLVLLLKRRNRCKRRLGVMTEMP
jgi:hypothetical protein